MDFLTFIVSLVILLMSIVMHELCHGYVAELLGDPTPRLQGRLTLNPLKHIDPVGSILVPIITSFSGFTFGWAKPIQWNPYNVKNKKSGEILISLAGPGANLVIALVFGLIIRFAIGSLSESLLYIMAYVAMINIGLAVFNLIPIPPLDGSKIFLALIPPRYNDFRMKYERYSIFLVFFIVIFLWQFIEPAVPFIFRIITGISLG